MDETPPLDTLVVAGGDVDALLKQARSTADQVTTVVEGVMRVLGRSGDMKRPVSERVTLVEVLELTGPFETFAATVQAAARRLEAEGVSGLARVQFYATPGSSEVGAIITFAAPSQIMDHIRMISDWPEFKALLGVVKPVDVQLYGRLGEEALAWVRKMNVVSKTFERHVAGFVRSP